ncbi:MAG: phage tail assembly protein [Aeromonas veronii]
MENTNQGPTVTVLAAEPTQVGDLVSQQLNQAGIHHTTEPERVVEPQELRGDGWCIIPLPRPIRGMTSIRIREPSAGELRGLDVYDLLRMNIQAHRTLIPRISQLTANDLDTMRPREIMAVMQEVVGFFVE